MNRGRSLLPALLLAALPLAAVAQDYPRKPIRLIMPNAPGSSIDTVGRLIGVRLGEVLGQTIVIENRAEIGRASCRERVSRCV